MMTDRLPWQVAFAAFTHRAGASWRGLMALSVTVLLAACSGGDSSGSSTGTASVANASARTAATMAAANPSAWQARYVQLQALSEINGNPWTSVAEFDVLDANGTPLPRGGWSVSADSQELVGENGAVGNTIDGNAYSYWHTQWLTANPPPPHALTVDMGSTQAISGFRYLPRQIGENGRIANWRLLTSLDGATWTVASQGTFPTGTDAQTVMLSTPPVDHPPVLAAVANRTDTFGAALSLALSATDVDGDKLTYAATGLPNGLSIDPAAGVISGSPTAVGVFQVALQVSDGRGAAASGSFTWSIVAPASNAAAASARYVRLQALSEVNGNPWTSVAEFNVLDASGAAIARTGWKASADSQELVGENGAVGNAIDGDAYSYWHTQWLTSNPPPPHALTVDMGQVHSVGGFRYLPRQIGVNGRIANWAFYTSIDGLSWSLMSQGTFPNTTDEQTALATPAVTTLAPAQAAAPVLATRAARIAAFASGPLVAAPAWSAGRSVAVDAVLRLASGTHLVYTAAGTTGPAEPTAVDGRPIADGSATAYVNGRVLTATQSNAPTVGSAASPAAAGLTLTPFAVGNFQPAQITAVQGCKSISNGTAFLGHYCFANGPAGGSGNATAYAAGPWGAGLSPNYVYHANTWEEEFIVTDSLFGLVFSNSVSPINVEVDGVQVQGGPTSSTGASGWTLTLDFHGVVQRRTIRLVSAVGAVLPTLQGVALSTRGKVEAGVTSADQFLVLGDSINATVVPGSEAGAQIMSYWIQRYLGFGGAINMAVGGSGYISANAGSYNIPDLLANPVNQGLIASYAPNITHVIIGAGFNDRTRPVANVQASALATWQTVRKLLPNAKISITDGWSGSSGPDANALALASGLAATFAAWGDPNSRLIHSIGGSVATAYVSGTGNAGLPITTGNSSYYTSSDATHPSPAGARYLARRLSDDIGTAWAGAY